MLDTVIGVYQNIFHFKYFQISKFKLIIFKLFLMIKVLISSYIAIMINRKSK